MLLIPGSPWLGPAGGPRCPVCLLPEPNDTLMLAPAGLGTQMGIIYRDVSGRALSGIVSLGHWDLLGQLLSAQSVTLRVFRVGTG